MNNGLKTHYFLNKKFIIYEGTYIPHFETEYIITKVEKYSKANNLTSVFEVGSGSGCIPIMLKQRNKELSVVTIEKDEEVYRNAISNIAVHKTNVTCLNVSIENINKVSADILVSNPPYIKSKEAETISCGCKNVRRNIDGGEDGLDVVRTIFNRSHDVKYCIFELGYQNSAEIISKEFESQWKLIENEKPLSNQEVYFCVFKNTRYWT